jgi:hypothetical protein
MLSTIRRGLFVLTGAAGLIAITASEAAAKLAGNHSEPFATTE